MNIGVRPSFGRGSRTVEIHLLDFRGDLYGRDIRVAVAARLRDERRFEDGEALREQIQIDLHQAGQALSAVIDIQ